MMESILCLCKKRKEGISKVDHLTFYENCSANLNKHLGLSLVKKNHFEMSLTPKIQFGQLREYYHCDGMNSGFRMRLFSGVYRFFTMRYMIW